MQTMHKAPSSNSKQQKPDQNYSIRVTESQFESRFATDPCSFH